MSDAATWTELALGKQRAQAAANADAERMKFGQTREMLSAGLEAENALMAFMQKRKVDDIANKLRNSELVPRAVAVDPMGNPDAEKNAAAVAKYPTQLTAGQVKPFTGGMAEMQMRDNAMNQQMRRDSYLDFPRRSSMGQPIPPAALRFLRDNPDTAGDFDARYGQGLANYYLRP